MNTEDSLREYLRLFVKVPLVGRIGPLARTFDFVADAAPGVKEILAVGKLAYEVRERHYDLVVVDAEASGHIVAQIAAPAGDQRARAGRAWSATRRAWMTDILEDPAMTGLVIVTTPEEMPVTETIDLIGRLDRRDRRRRRRRSSPTASCRRCSTAARPRSSTASARSSRCSSRPPGPACARCSPPPTSPRPAAASATGTSSGCAPASRRPARALRARAVHQGDRPARRRARRQGARRGTGRGVT